MDRYVVPNQSLYEAGLMEKDGASFKVMVKASDAEALEKRVKDLEAEVAKHIEEDTHQSKVGHMTASVCIQKGCQAVNTQIENENLIEKVQALEAELQEAKQALSEKVSAIWDAENRTLKAENARLRVMLDGAMTRLDRLTWQKTPQFSPSLAADYQALAPRTEEP